MATIRGRETPPRVHIFGHIHEDRGKVMLPVIHEFGLSLSLSLSLSLVITFHVITVTCRIIVDHFIHIIVLGHWVVGCSCVVIFSL